MVDSFSPKELYAFLREELGSSFEARQLFLHATGLEPYRLSPGNAGPMLAAKQTRKALELVRRRKAGEPLQYLLGEWEFYGLPFLVGEGVLIPRGDTETLVDAALDAAQGLLAPCVLDLCSGSGAVAVAIAHKLPGAEVCAVELSQDAFEYLEKNIALNKASAKAVRANIFSYLPPKRLDIITANPPYIPSGELEGLQEEVRREPVLALDGGQDGLDFYRRIPEYYRRFLNPGGTLCLEIGIHQQQAVADILLKSGFSSPQVYKDLAGIPRALRARINEKAP